MWLLSTLQPHPLPSVLGQPASSHSSLFSALGTIGTTYITGPLAKRPGQAWFLLAIQDSNQMSLPERVSLATPFIIIHVFIIFYSIHVYFFKALIHIWSCPAYWSLPAYCQRPCLSYSLCCVSNARFSDSHINHWIHIIYIKELLPIWQTRADADIYKWVSEATDK